MLREGVTLQIFFCICYISKCGWILGEGCVCVTPALLGGGTNAIVMKVRYEEPLALISEIVIPCKSCPPDLWPACCLAHLVFLQLEPPNHSGLNPLLGGSSSPMLDTGIKYVSKYFSKQQVHFPTTAIFGRCCRFVHVIAWECDHKLGTCLFW